MDINQTPNNPNIRTAIAPERSVGMSAPTLEPDKAPDKKSRRGLYVAIGSIAGLAIAGGAVFGGIAASQVPASQPTAEAPADPTAVPSAEATNSAELLTPEDLVLPESLTPEQLGTAFVQDRLSTWEMAGAIPENENKWVTSDTFLDETSNKNGDLIADAIMVPNWRDIPALATWVAGEKQSNAGSIDNFFKTFDSGQSADVEPYNRGITAGATSVVSQDNTTLVIATEGTEFTNSDKNRIGTTLAGPNTASINGNKILVTTTFVVLNGTWRISAVSIVNNN
ncbi:MAG: hypothetical protein JWP19_2225 [Rhodoglobus sp.]|nr:hypothetical protein [Rhodoglobus sp.]